jgi:DNA-binding response OmpR family regulator
MKTIDLRVSLRQRLVLAGANTSYKAQVYRHFRRLGWDVYLVDTGNEARRLARIVRPAVVVLDTDLPDETGWLTCDKLTRESPGPQVILVGLRNRPEQADFAAFVGASAYVWRHDGVRALAGEILGDALCRAC